MLGPLVNGSSQTVAPFQFPFIILLHGRGAFFNLQPSLPSSTSILVANFIPRRLQLQPSLPSSTSILVANFIPRRLQLQSSLPTSSLVANFNPRRLQLQPSSSFNFQTALLFYFLPFSLMHAVCLMLLLPDEIVT
jgi:hypothetical protein